MSEFKTLKVLGFVSETQGSAKRVSVVRIGDKPMLDIRTMYKKKGDDEFLPTQKGVTVAIEDMADLSALLSKGIKYATRRDLATPAEPKDAKKKKSSKKAEPKDVKPKKKKSSKKEEPEKLSKVKRKKAIDPELKAPKRRKLKSKKNPLGENH